MKTSHVGKYLRMLLLTMAVVLIGGVLVWVGLETSADKGGTVQGILTGAPCAPPCWQGITPGTSMERQEVIRLLKKIPNVDTVWESGAAIRWTWKQWPSEGTGYNSVYVSWDGVVHDIMLSVDFDLTVEEILDQYGLPDATNFVVAGVPEHAYGAMNMFYPAHGFYCTAEVLPYDKPVLEPESRIFQVLYLVPADSMEDRFGSDVNSMDLQPWPGYGALEVASP